MRFLAAILFALVSAPAWAVAPCASPPLTNGWAQSFPTGIQVKGFLYDQSNLRLYVTMADQRYWTFFNVPTGVMNGFTTTKTPDAFFNSQIQGRYQESLETETCGLLLNEDGRFLLTFPA